MLKNKIEYVNFLESNDIDSLNNLIKMSTTHGFDSCIGIQYDQISPDQVKATLNINKKLHQPAGIVHGGVFTSVVEAAGSAGGSAWLCSKNSNAVFVGTGNTTDFIRPVSEGTLDILASPIQRGKTIQLWEIEIRDQNNKLVSTGRLKGQNIFTNKETPKDEK